MNENKPGCGKGLWTRAWAAASAMGLAAVLSACGGGGDKAPSNTGQPPVVDPSATGQSAFGLNLVYQSINGVNTEALQVVDLRTGTVALSVDGKASGSGSVESTNTGLYAFTGGTTGRYDGISQLFTVEGHQLKQRDLRGKSVGAAQTVYALTTVCTAYHVHALNKEGDQGWVEVITADTAAECSTGTGAATGTGTGTGTGPSPITATSLPQTRLVPFGVAGADTAVLSGSKGLDWVSNLYDKPDEPAIGILAIDRTQGLLKVYSTDLKRVLSTVTLPSLLSATDTVSIEGTLPTSTAPVRALLRIGAKLYLASIAGTQVSLGNVVRTLKSTASFDAITDGQNLYFADGNTLVEVSAAGTLKAFPPLAANVRVNQLNVTGGSLVFTQTTSFGVTTFVTALDLASGALTQLVTDDGSGFFYQILRAEGGAVWIESTDRGTRRSEITRIKVDGTDLQGVMSGIVHVALLSPSSFTFGSAPKADAVLWCEVPEGMTACLNLWQTELSSGSSVLLGAVPIDASWTFDSLYEFGGASADRASLLSLGQAQAPLPGAFTGNQKGSTLWFTPGQAGSLKAVVVPKP